jgi:hypothetical protein
VAARGWAARRETAAGARAPQFDRSPAAAGLRLVDEPRVWWGCDDGARAGELASTSANVRVGSSRSASRALLGIQRPDRPPDPRVEHERREVPAQQREWIPRGRERHRHGEDDPGHGRNRHARAPRGTAGYPGGWSWRQHDRVLGAGPRVKGSAARSSSAPTTSSRRSASVIVVDLILESGSSNDDQAG